MPTVDVADRVADELVQWLETRSTQVADAILESAYRPRVVEPTTAEAVAYYRSVLILPDGSLNEAGKQQLIQQVGARGYRDVCRSLARALNAEQEETFAAARAEAVAAIDGEEVAA